MDLNQLLYHHQVALIHSNRHNVEEDEPRHFDLVGYYAKRIRAYRKGRGLSEYPTGYQTSHPPFWRE